MWMWGFITVETRQNWLLAFLPVMPLSSSIQHSFVVSCRCTFILAVTNCKKLLSFSSFLLSAYIVTSDFLQWSAAKSSNSYGEEKYLVCHMRLWAQALLLTHLQA